MALSPIIIPICARAAGAAAGAATVSVAALSAVAGALLVQATSAVDARANAMRVAMRDGAKRDAIIEAPVRGDARKVREWGVLGPV